MEEAWVGGHTVGYEQLAPAVAEHPPERAAPVCGVEAGDIRRAAEILGSCERLVSTVLQGVYQSHQATAAPIQVNNIHLLWGMIGKGDSRWKPAPRRRARGNRWRPYLTVSDEAQKYPPARGRQPAEVADLSRALLAIVPIWSVRASSNSNVRSATPKRAWASSCRKVPQ